MATNLFKFTVALGIGAMIPVQSAWAQQSEADQGDSGRSGEIVVTAQRRAERLTDVPMTVAQVTGEQLAQRGVGDTLGLQRVTAGLQLPLYGAFLSPSIRGVSTAVTNAGVSSNVAFYLDGVYQATQIGQLMDLPDVESVEILKGPQGTLYGQNAEGGAIVIKTITPSFTPSGKVSLSYGNYNDWQARGYVTGPLIEDKLAISVAASWQDRNGFLTGIVDGKRDSGLKQRMVRGKLLFQANDDISFTLSGYYTRRKDSSTFTGQPFKGLSIAGMIDPALVSPHDASVTTIQPGVGFTNLRSWGVNFLGQFDLGIGEVQSVTAYSDSNALNSVDLDYSPANLFANKSGVPNKSFVQEINFVSRKIGGAIITAGLFYQNTKENIRPNIFSVYDGTIYPAPLNVVFIGQDGESPAENTFYAAYADISYELTPRLTVSAGGRYTHHKMSGAFTQFSDVSPPVPLVYSPSTWNDFSPRFTARYKVADDANIYVNYAKGFKAGLINVSDPAGEPLDPEKLTSYEVGFKARLFNQLQLGLSGFWYDYKDKQVAYYDPPLFPAQNAASARMKGIDLDFSWRVTPNFTISGSGEYLDAKFREYPAAAVYIPDPATGGLQSIQQDLGGHRVDRAPKFTGTISGDYEIDLGDGRFNLHASLYHSSKTLWDPNGLIYQKPYELLDIEAGFAPAAVEGLRIVLYGKNLTNEAYLQSSLETTFAAGVSYSPPRQYGIRGEFAF